MMELATPDIIYRGAFHGAHRVVRQGREACIELGRVIGAIYEPMACDIGDLVIDGERAAVRRTLTLRNRGTGKVGQVEVCNFLVVRAGLMAELDEFVDYQALGALGGWP